MQNTICIGSQKYKIIYLDRFLMNKYTDRYIWQYFKTNNISSIDIAII